MMKTTKISVMIGAMAFFMYSCGSETATTEEVTETTAVEEEIESDAIAVDGDETPLEALLDEGKDIYQSKCQVCHKTNGEGIEGMIPPLAQSEFLNNHIEKGIDVVLNGLEGEIEVNGEKYDARMPKLNLSESQVASVLSYVLNQWGNSGDVITKYEVRDVANRINPMVSDEELVAMKDAGYQIYMEKCRLCHVADGSGQEGVTPPLNNSSFLLKNIDKGIEFVTRGYSGEIEVNGKTYNGTMPPQGLDARQTAEVFTYILNSWDNPGIVVTEEDVNNVLETLPPVEEKEAEL